MLPSLPLAGRRPSLEPRPPFPRRTRFPGCDAILWCPGLFCRRHRWRTSGAPRTDTGTCGHDSGVHPKRPSDPVWRRPAVTVASPKNPGCPDFGRPDSGRLSFLEVLFFEEN